MTLRAADLPCLDALSTSDPMAVVYLKTARQNTSSGPEVDGAPNVDGPEFVEIGRTEVRKNDLNPCWGAQFKVSVWLRSRFFVVPPSGFATTFAGLPMNRATHDTKLSAVSVLFRTFFLLICGNNCFRFFF